MMSAHSCKFPHWSLRLLAAVIPCATLPLIFVGGLVTTTAAGMAVPDWPGTFGYNLFLYPWDTWWAGPWDLFVEHGHRLLGALLGILSIALCLLAWFQNTSRAFQYCTVITLLLVCSQGILGGLRVRMDARFFAMLHGCTGPLVFAVTLVQAELLKPVNSTVTISTNETNSVDLVEQSAGRNAMLAWGLALLVMSYIQLVFGAQLRHGHEWLSPAGFKTATWLHLVGAGIVSTLVILVTLRQLTGSFAVPGYLVSAIATCLFLQLILGLWTWVFKYGWPWGYEDMPGSLQRLVGDHLAARSLAQVLITTSHVAVGSLILGLTARLVTRTWRAASGFVSVTNLPLQTGVAT